MEEKKQLVNFFMCASYILRVICNAMVENTKKRIYYVNAIERKQRNSLKNENATFQYNCWKSIAFIEFNLCRSQISCTHTLVNYTELKVRYWIKLVEKIKKL